MSIQGKNSLDCWFFQNKTCTKGDSCPFVHDPSHAAAPVTSSKAVCKFWREGRCGALSCQFLHSEPNIKKSTVCRFFSQGKCGKGDACPFQHVLPENGERIPSNGLGGALMVGRTSRHAEPLEGGAVGTLSASLPQTPPPDEDESTPGQATTLERVNNVAGQKHKLTDSAVKIGTGQSATGVAAEILKRRKLVRVSESEKTVPRPTSGVASAAMDTANSSRKGLVMGRLGPVVTSKPEPRAPSLVSRLGPEVQGRGKVAPKPAPQSAMKERPVATAPPLSIASRLGPSKQGSGVGAGVQKPLPVGASKACDKSLDFEVPSFEDILKKKRAQQGAAVSREEPVRAAVGGSERVGLRRGEKQLKTTGGLKTTVSVGTDAAKKDKPRQAASVASTAPNVKPHASKLDFEVPSFEDIIRKKKTEQQRTAAAAATMNLSKPSPQRASKPLSQRVSSSEAAPALSKAAAVVSASPGPAPGPEDAAVNCTSGQVVVPVVAADPVVKDTAVVSKLAHLDDELAEFEAMLDG